MSEQRNPNGGDMYRVTKLPDETITKELVAGPTLEARTAVSVQKTLEFINPTNEDLLTALRVCGSEREGCRACPLLKKEPCSNLFEVLADRISQQERRIETLERAFALACRILADNAMLCPQEVFETEWEECDGEADKCGDADMWKCWQRFINETVETERVCRVCGCTEMNACVGKDAGDNCCWGDEDLCSACIPEPKGGQHA